MDDMKSLKALEEKARWVRCETLNLHKLAPESRLASSLSAVEIFVSLYYGGFLKYDPADVFSQTRDRVILSKGHGSVSLYPILADLGFFSKDHLAKINQPCSLLRAIPDMTVPGFETINGALGHGLGVACGMALALKAKRIDRRVYVLCGDGELNEGSIWESVMFAAFHKLNNLVLIIDDNKISMLGYQNDILGMEPLAPRFGAFGWQAEEVDGHNIEQLCRTFKKITAGTNNSPIAIVAQTIKGKGAPQLEGDPLCHVKSLNAAQIDVLLKGFE